METSVILSLLIRSLPSCCLVLSQHQSWQRGRLHACKFPFRPAPRDSWMPIPGRPSCHMLSQPAVCACVWAHVWHTSQRASAQPTRSAGVYGSGGTGPPPGMLAGSVLADSTFKT